MTDKTRLRIGAGVTVLFLAALSAAGLAARDGQPAGTATSARTTASAPAPDGPATGRPENDGGEHADETERGALDAALSALAGVAGLDGDDGAERGDDEDDHEELEDDE
jgi:hypothetical protein